MVDLDPQLTAVNWNQRRSSRDPVVAVLACSVSRVGAELERVAGLGADVVYLDTPPRAWVGADNAALAAAKLADLVLLPCRPSILDLEATVTTMQRLQAVTAAPVVVALNQVPARGRDADEAAEALTGQRVEVCPVRIGAPAVFAPASFRRGTPALRLGGGRRVGAAGALIMAAVTIVANGHADDRAADGNSRNIYTRGAPRVSVGCRGFQGRSRVTPR